MASIKFRSAGDLALGGMTQLSSKLNRLKDKDARRVGRNAIRVGLRVGAKDLRKAVPRGETNAIRSSVGISLKKNKRNKAGVDEGKWGVNVGKKRKDMAAHGFAVMAGTGERTTKSGRRTGQIVITRRVTFESALRSRSAVLTAIRVSTAAGIKRVLNGQSPNDGGAALRAEFASQKKAAKHRKKLEKKKAAAKKVRDRKYKQFKKSIAKRVKAAKRSFNRQVKSVKKSVSRVTKRATKAVKKFRGKKRKKSRR